MRRWIRIYQKTMQENTQTRVEWCHAPRYQSSNSIDILSRNRTQTSLKMLSARVAFLFLSCTVLGQYPQPINPYPYMPYPYQIFPYPPPYPSTPDPYAHIPTEIIDLDENVILPETATFGAVAEEPQITILKNTQQHVTSNSAPSKTVHVFESKPIQTVIRRTIVTDGRDGQKVISINLLNGKEVTTSTTEAAKVESSEEEDKEDKDEDDGSDPKPINSWLFPG